MFSQPVCAVTDRDQVLSSVNPKTRVSCNKPLFAQRKRSFSFAWFVCLDCAKNFFFHAFTKLFFFPKFASELKNNKYYFLNFINFSHVNIMWFVFFFQIRAMWIVLDLGSLGIAKVHQIPRQIVHKLIAIL